MVQVRKLVLAIAAASALSSGMARALDLGEVTLKSAANQPLVAEIELLDVRDLAPADIKPSLATPEEFQKAGVNRDAILSDLTFTPVINSGGRSVIRVTSRQPVSEPMLKFLVQVLWPQGRLLRDYSVMVDASKFAPQGAAPVQPAATPAVTAPTPAKQGEFTTGKRDTLWDIAQKYPNNGASVQQTMLAIQALNPDAFVDGNINRLKTGQVLRLPDSQQATALGQGPAITEVARQNAAWREGRRLGPRAQQLDATRRTGTGNAPAQTEAGDKLSLVAADGKNGQGKAGDRQARLAQAKENLDATRRDNAELKSRMGDLQSQLDKLQKLIQLKNDQLAKLEAAGAAAPAPAPAPAEAAAPAAPAAEAPAPAVNAQLTPPPEAAPATPAPEAVTPPPAPVVTAPVEPPAPVEDKPGLFTKLLTSPIMLGLVGGAAVLILLLAALLLARKRKAQLEAEKHMRMARALSEETDFDKDIDLPPGSFEGLETPAPSVKLAPAMVAASAAAAVAAAEPAPVVAAPHSEVIPTPPLRPAAEPVVVAPVVEPLVASVIEPVPAPVAQGEPAADVLAEADRLLAEHRFNEAVELLEPAVKAEPARSDLRLKLMEAYAHQGDRSAFIGEERQLVANGENHNAVENLKARFPAMLGVAMAAASAAAVAAELDAQYVKDLLMDEPGSADPIDDTFDSDFDLNLDDDLSAPAEPDLDVADFDDDLELDAPQPLEAAANPEPEVEAPSALDEDDLDFEALLAQHNVPAEEPPVDDLAEFDLDIADDEPAAPALAPEAQAELDAQLADFENELNLDKPEVPPAPVDDLELPEDFDLSLAEEMDSAPASTPDKLHADLGDVSAELDELSASLEHPPIAEPFKAPEPAALDDLDNLDDLPPFEDDFDYLSGTDESATKLDLARAYIDMGDHDGARDILDEVVKEGTAGQQTEAREMLSKLV
ncbi:FimV/HubP family polar landmark protein [Pseudomonas sp. TE3610]